MVPERSPNTTVYMVRHSEVSDAWRGRIYGALDVPLSERGEAQSAQAAAGLSGVPLNAVISSGLARAEHTAALLRAGSAWPLERHDDPRFMEIDRGAWAGLDRAGVEALSPGGWDAFWESGGLALPPGGEDLATISARVCAALDELAARFAPGPIAIVAHKWVLRVAAVRALGWKLDECIRLDLPYSGMAVLGWPAAGADRGQPELLAVTPHTCALDGTSVRQPGPRS